MEQLLLADSLNIFSSPLITEIVITAGKTTHILSQVEGATRKGKDDKFMETFGRKT
jgi:hypothetical protein